MKTYRELHPTKEGKRLWRYITTKRGVLPLYGLDRNHAPCELLIDGHVIAEIRNGWLAYRAGYAWNGCSPKRYIGWPPFGFWAGTPDFESTHLASLGHDILFQFSAYLNFRFEDVNDLFFTWIDDAGASDLVRDIYHGAVDMMGSKFWRKKCETLSVRWL
jgi:hypothetical protein